MRCSPTQRKESRLFLCELTIPLHSVLVQASSSEGISRLSWQVTNHFKGVENVIQSLEVGLVHDLDMDQHDERPVPRHSCKVDQCSADPAAVGVEIEEPCV